jgi:hypothetical protein
VRAGGDPRARPSASARPPTLEWLALPRAWRKAASDWLTPVSGLESRTRTRTRAARRRPSPSCSCSCMTPDPRISPTPAISGICPVARGVPPHPPHGSHSRVGGRARARGRARGFVAASRPHAAMPFRVRVRVRVRVPRPESPLGMVREPLGWSVNHRLRDLRARPGLALGAGPSRAGANRSLDPPRRHDCAVEHRHGVERRITRRAAGLCCAVEHRGGAETHIAGSAVYRVRSWHPPAPQPPAPRRQRRSVTVPTVAPRRAAIGRPPPTASSHARARAFGSVRLLPSPSCSCSCSTPDPRISLTPAISGVCPVTRGLPPRPPHSSHSRSGVEHAHEGEHGGSPGPPPPAVLRSPPPPAARNRWRQLPFLPMIRPRTTKDPQAAK